MAEGKRTVPAEGGWQEVDWGQDRIGRESRWKSNGWELIWEDLLEIALFLSYMEC